jgi:hypothetical protein
MATAATGLGGAVARGRAGPIGGLREAKRTNVPGRGTISGVVEKRVFGWRATISGFGAVYYPGRQKKCLSVETIANGPLANRPLANRPLTNVLSKWRGLSS